METVDNSFTTPTAGLTPRREVLKWIDHPLKKSGKNLLIVVLFLIVAPAVVFFSTKSLLFLFLSIIFLLGSLSTCVSPTGYPLSTNTRRTPSIFNTGKVQRGKYRSFY